MLRNTGQLKKKIPPILGLAKAIRLREKNSQGGLSLLEILVAIVVISAVISAITPAIFLSVASRVQNRRAQQAQQLANGAVDRVRRLVASTSYSEEALKRVVPVTVGGELQASDVQPSDKDQLVDLDGDTIPDFRVQVFRTTLNEIKDQDGKGKPVIFKLGVRVYFLFPNQQNPPLLKEPASLKMTSGMGWKDKDGRIRPLAVAYTTIAQGDNPDALCYLGQSLGKSFEQQCPTK
ncbi:prepilin-type N-terminal cleavage/methylation domain-containing protein [Aerosakkonemataceae cyanobacterium BLCC-F154]|uniref:Prepilin-type N-terminal cleavage/methylation domain-containing protein n=1 Tax=Floridaenema fluviatile BLCC-F154 TaxID=3153640 RepID=A0ABV4YEM2_9CYAN